MSIPKYVEAICNRDLLTEPFQDKTTGRWFAFPNGGVMAIQIEIPSDVLQEIRFMGQGPMGFGESVIADLRRRLREQSLAAIHGELQGAEYSAINSRSTQSQEMESIVRRHFREPFLAPLLFYARSNDINAIRLDSRVTTISLRSNVANAAHIINHSIGHWIWEYDERRGQLIAPSHFFFGSITRCQLYLESALSIHSDVKDISNFQATSLEEVCHQYCVAGIGDRLRVAMNYPMPPMQFSGPDPLEYITLIYELVHRDSLYRFDRIR